MDTTLLVLAPQEVALVGNWIALPSGAAADETCKRVEALTAGVLELIAEHPEDGGWTTLFRDPRDGRFWERTYPQSHLHGGGPPALHYLSATEARLRYRL